MRHLVLGTAGHIDHGKSALVEALTGIDPDRLKEEKQRGITIELGFADMDLDEKRGISFVDVPGHERFVRQMVAGATGIDAVLLVIAADQGVQPQTREHLEVCSLLGLERGVVTLSKCDLVDADLQEVVTLEVRELLEGTFLETAPIVPVSARSGAGLEALRGELERLLDVIPERPADGIARLPVDRSFVLRGFGAVVTGTLVSGVLNEGDEVEVLPGGRRGRIRGLQVHRHKVARARAGQRTAVNLQGLDRDQVPRGATLTLPGRVAQTRRIWARVSLLPGAPKNLEQGGPVRFHQGTCQRAARYRVLEREESGALDVELYLGSETALVPGDRFILRRPAPVDTIGGGVVMDVDPPPRRAADPRAFTDDALNPAGAAVLRLARAGAAGRDGASLGPLLGVTPEGREQLGRELEKRGEIVRAASAWFHAAGWTRAGQEALRHLQAFHDAEPLRRGMTREQLRFRTCAAMPLDAWRQLLEGLSAAGAVRLDGELVALAGHEVVLDGADRELSTRIEESFRSAGLHPPEIDELVESGDRERAGKIVALLIAGGQLVRIQDGKLFHSAALSDLRTKLREYARRSETIGVAAFKELAGITRKNAIPLLEQLDAERTTRRVGNVRVILDGG